MRVRFAPSPTGPLHIGGARTALYNWLLARGHDGTFVLRIEDTDRQRSTPENVEQILDALRWLKLDWDEGPISQASRVQRHREIIERLLRSGDAYRSNRTQDDVRAYRERHGADRGFRGEPEDTGAVLMRFPDSGDAEVRDIVYGTVRSPHVSQDDFVIARADGTPTYMLAVTVDDLDSGITHVVRGVDHLPNTPKQMLIFQALGEEPPQYAHVPLLHGPDGKKLSKRHGAASVQELRDAGYLPEAVDNYIALLGAGFAADAEKFSLDELAQRFRLDRVSKNPAIFDEKKLRHLNGQYLRELEPDELTARLEQFTGRSGLAPAVAIAAEKIQTLADFWPLVGFLFDGPADDAAAFERIITKDGGVECLQAARSALAGVEPFTVDQIEAALRGVVESQGVKSGKVFQPVRVAIAGSTISPGIFESVALLGRAETLARIDRALERAPGTSTTV
ncbi:MAG: glutamyl-tRNA synthetase [Solirubrobacteraceae bacterium]|nr:glutamyl-tRNA synthetase [Solirubrobacteraceae bacterium]